MADSNRFARPTYSKDQLSKFYERIKLPQSVRDRINSPEWSPDWDTLETLQLYTVCSVPFECLSLHYSKDKKITIDANYLYKKIVEDDNGRGGYCMENNNLFGTVLRSIGYAAYPVGARVNSDTNEGDVPAVYFAWYVKAWFDSSSNPSSISSFLYLPVSILPLLLHCLLFSTSTSLTSPPRAKNWQVTYGQRRPPPRSKIPSRRRLWGERTTSSSHSPGRPSRARSPLPNTKCWTITNQTCA